MTAQLMSAEAFTSSVMRSTSPRVVMPLSATTRRSAGIRGAALGVFTLLVFGLVFLVAGLAFKLVLAPAMVAAVLPEPLPNW